ncbi:MAG: sialidase family protein, partial [Candidatus Korobacteraceae bacterium]
KDDSGFAQIYVARSNDMGRTWETHRATDGKRNCGYPEIAVTNDEAVGVLYIDYDDSGQETIFRHRFFVSLDQGKNWRGRTLQELWPSALGPVPSGFMWGDYEGLVACQDTFFGVFTGASIGRTHGQLDPIFFRVDSHDFVN